MTAKNWLQNNPDVKEQTQEDGEERGVKRPWNDDNEDPTMPDRPEPNRAEEGISDQDYTQVWCLQRRKKHT